MLLAYSLKHTILAVQMFLSSLDFFFNHAVICRSLKGRHLRSKNK